MHNGIQGVWTIIVLALSIAGIVIYFLAGFLSNRKGHLQPWPIYRYILWTLGILAATVPVIGPLAEWAHTNFTAHMLGHLLLGMLAPLLLVLSAPVTLVLRTLPVRQARFIANFLKSFPISVLSNPIIASILNIGGLWLLYTTNLYHVMHHNLLVYLLIHFHVFAAGYLFTAAMIYIDPTPHRFSYLYRSIVLVFALGAHAILSKYIYAHPPIGVPTHEAEAGGMLMYYGGDAIDLVLIFILMLHWYRSAAPRQALAKFETV
ncbi:cytochrome c oxidase assembly factor [Oceanobacillus picturae]|jgi:putative membrane protein|uniref:Cytochrome c oxidase assembly factor n=1 Tax=Oceanobacillus picturae TaxID=171693 RepID=A0A0U9H6N9_9BACI|nr:cytochrome c oxidase assembly protein [Oceanobacillus picturae]GAQ18306.1 cytochrome c oxidase assembly factor [Oceanobacillus picturae]